jgi:hypothetical protein
VTEGGSGIGAGDVIGVMLDMDKKELSFYKNNVSLGVAFRNIPSTKWFALPFFEPPQPSSCFITRHGPLMTTTITTITTIPTQ